jgi:hypothetical protein
MRLTATNTREFGADARDGEARLTWNALQAYEEAGLIRIDAIRHRPGYAPYELNPVVRLNPDAYERACELLEREPTKLSRASIWKAALANAFPGETMLHEALAASWIEVEGHRADEVADQLRLLRLFAPGTFLRHVSAQLFWGDSKVLDGREAMICAVLGTSECPFPESPIQLQVELPEEPFDAVLLIENVMTFEHLRMRRRAGQEVVQPGALLRVAIAQAHGFRGAARRTRRPGGSSMYYAAGARQEAQRRFEAWWFHAAEEISVSWWGDLDFTGMSILKALRSAFPGATCWRPGYEPLLETLEAGGGHLPVAAGKDKQADPGEVGCLYADRVLLPAMKMHGRFVDQEMVLAAHDSIASFPPVEARPPHCARTVSENS